MQDFLDGKIAAASRLSSKSVLTLFIRPEQPGISKKVSRYDGKCAADIAA
ncbi:hypothetical protein [Bifidobacterium pseudocatenulatum]|nr:hypothetical protein [Bifidobacterium pseudocatenulatum]